MFSQVLFFSVRRRFASHEFNHPYPNVLHKTLVYILYSLAKHQLVCCKNKLKNEKNNSTELTQNT